MSKSRRKSLNESSASQAGPSEEKKSFEQREWGSLSQRERKQKVNGIIRFILCASSKKAPVKRDDVTKAVMDGKKCFNIALQHANEILDKDFGLKVEETKKGSQKVLILINNLPKETRNVLVKENDDTLSYYGLLSVVLSFLLMRPNQSIDEEQLWGLILNPLGIQSVGSDHPQFGSTKATIDLFLEQTYLEKEKVNAGGSTTWIYKWGPRAHLEVDKKELLLVMCEIYDEESFDLWEKQFGDLVKN